MTDLESAAILAKRWLYSETQVTSLNFMQTLHEVTKATDGDPICAMNTFRIPSLDGLRALAIILVILNHLHSGHSFRALDFLWKMELLGNTGVRIFFVLSGFLITSLLRLEYLKRGRNDLSAFYLRRALRIWPAYYFFLLVVLASILIGKQDFKSSELIGPALFISNYVPLSTMVLAHTWSLSVEEQFYLIWPFLIKIIGWRAASYVVLIFCIASPILRIFVAFSQEKVQIFWYHFEHAGDAIGWGCLYALARDGCRLPSVSAKNSARIAWAALGALLIISTSGGQPIFWAGIGSVLANVLVVLLLHGALNSDGTRLFNILNSRIATEIGVISFSLYLWQEVFLFGGFKIAAPWNLCVIFIFAYTSYYVIERPFLSLKNKLVKS